MDKKLIGSLGEEIASKFLINKGYQILDRNYYSPYGELDIVALKDNTIVIVEVKTRKNQYFQYASESINPQKILRIKKTTLDYLMNRLQKQFDYRFDVIECYYETKSINHIEDAF